MPSVASVVSGVVRARSLYGLWALNTSAFSASPKNSCEVNSSVVFVRLDRSVGGIRTDV